MFRRLHDHFRPSLSCPARAARPGRLGLAVLLSGGFITIFDLFVVNIAIPSMQRTLDASFAQINFIIVAYELAYGVLLIAGSRLGDRLGRRRLFVLGMLGFALTSALCGLAPDANALICARARCRAWRRPCCSRRCTR